MLLARKGYRVLLVDRASFPSDTISSHYIQQTGIAQLARWGLLEKVQASNCPPIRRVSFDFGPFTLVGSPPPTAEGIAHAYGPRRTVLDKILVDAAVAAGAELREGFSVQKLLTDGDSVSGILGQSEGGLPITEKARIIIGADGKHSLVARTVHAAVYNEKPPLECMYYAYWSGVPIEDIEFYFQEGWAIVAMPTNDGLTNLVVTRKEEKFHEFRADIEGHFWKTLAFAPGLEERIRNGKREERFLGMADLSNFFRKPYGAGWALVGDAGYHKDPATGQGITDAFRDAELLADAIDQGFSGRRPLPEALANYEQQRNAAAFSIYELVCQIATLEAPTPDVTQLYYALRENQPETDRFFGTIAGTVSIPEFFAPENIQRIIESQRT
jgi:2-polyprenyl-6-methoxyphenol hydroxylase-like FAD-dependent oxidoreductase